MTESKLFAPMVPTWARMRAEHHPWIDIILGNAKANRWADQGRWAALAYAITDDTSYAAHAWDKWRNGAAAPRMLAAGDDIREWFIEWALLYDVLRPYLDSLGVTASVAAVLRGTAERVLAGTLTTDSDQTLASYLGLALTDAVLAHDPAHEPFLSRQWKNPATGTTIPVGGLMSTGADRTTIRNCLSLYVKMAEGGNWIESSMYDLATTWHLYQGVTFLRHVHGVDHFPEVALFADAHRRMLLRHFHPSLKDAFQYGDEQQPNTLRSVDYDATFSALGHLPGDDELKAAIRGLEASVRATNNWPLKSGANPGYARYFYFADPYQGADDTWRGKALRAHYSPGQGHVYSGRGDTALHFTFCTIKELHVDHVGAIPFGDLQIVKGNDRAVYHPLGYAPEERTANQAVIMNRCGSFESTETVGFAEGDDYLYVAGVSAGCGPDIFSGYFDPPAPYLYELGRQIVRLGDVVIVHDRLHAENPFEQPHGTTGLKAISRYSAAVKARMEKRRGLKSILWHAPVAPSLNGKSLSWTVGNTVVRLEAVQGPDLTVEIVDTASADFAMRGNIFTSQLKWAAVCTPPDRAFDSIVWGIDLSGAAMFEPWVAGDLTGVKVLRPNQPDAVVVFSRKPGPKAQNTFVGGKLVFDRTKAQTVFKARLLTSGDVPAFDVHAGTRVYIADLQAGTTVLVNGVAYTSTTSDVLFAATAMAVPPPPPAKTAKELINEMRERLDLLALMVP